MGYMHQFNPAFQIVIWDGIHMSGWTNDMINVTKDERDWKIDVGPDDSAVVTKINNSVARVTLSFQQVSPVNNQLNARRLLGMTGMLKLGAFSMSNINSSEFVKSARAFIEGPPDIGVEADPTARVWSLILHQAVISVGGAVV